MEFINGIISAAAMVTVAIIEAVAARDRRRDHCAAVPAA